jgi:hypothetical protein
VPRDDAEAAEFLLKSLTTAKPIVDDETHGQLVELMSGFAGAARKAEDARWSWHGKPTSGQTISIVVDQSNYVLRSETSMAWGFELPSMQPVLVFAPTRGIEDLRMWDLEARAEAAKKGSVNPAIVHEVPIERAFRVANKGAPLIPPSPDLGAALLSGEDLSIWSISGQAQFSGELVRVDVTSFLMRPEASLAWGLTADNAQVAVPLPSDALENLLEEWMQVCRQQTAEGFRAPNLSIDAAAEIVFPVPERIMSKEQASG